MTLHVDPAEWFWLLVNGTSIVLTAWAVRDARQKHAAVRELNGRAREITAAGNVRREALRLVTQVLLLAVVVPGLFIDRPIVLWSEAGLNVALILLIAAPVAILANTVLDAIDRHRVFASITADVGRRAGDA